MNDDSAKMDLAYGFEDSTESADTDRAGSTDDWVKIAGDRPQLEAAFRELAIALLDAAISGEGSPPDSNGGVGGIPGGLIGE